MLGVKHGEFVARYILEFPPLPADELVAEFPPSAPFATTAPAAGPDGETRPEAAGVAEEPVSGWAAD